MATDREISKSTLNRAENSVQEGVLPFSKGCVCVCPHMGANFLKEWLLGTRISLATVETLFYQVAGIPRTSLLSITPGNKTGKNRCPRKVKTHALKTLTL